MLKELHDYNWAEVFGEGGGGNCTTLMPIRHPGSAVSTDRFGREDVAEIIAMSEGENDERSWVLYGKLKDGRYFSARGSCDYTGWDCHASNSSNVEATREEIERFGLDIDERERFGIVLP